MIALAPRGDAITQPILFRGDLAIKLMRRAFFFFERGVAPGLEFGKAAREDAGAAAIEPRCAARKILQKSPVVADDHESGAGDFQLRLEPLDRRQIEMIGRLVEKHNIGLRRERAGKRRPPRLAAGKPRRIFLAGQPQFIQECPGVMAIIGGAKPRLDIGECGGIAGKIGLLRQIPHRGAGLQKARPAIWLNEARRDVQKRRFARSIAPHKAQTLARRDRQRSPLEQRFAAEGKRNIL